MRNLLVAALLSFAVILVTLPVTAAAGDCGCKKCEATCDKCKQDTCTTCKPKCDTCKPKCEKPCCEKKECNKCDECKPKCNKCKQDTCTTCKPKCEDRCKKDECIRLPERTHHPYECCYTGFGMMCDTGCCGVKLPCKRQCMDCETICKKVEHTDPCTGCVTVEWVEETVCHEVERPRVIPWWFNETGRGNIYPDDEEGESEEAGAA